MNFQFVLTKGENVSERVKRDEKPIRVKLIFHLSQSMSSGIFFIALLRFNPYICKQYCFQLM